MTGNIALITLFSVGMGVSVLAYIVCKVHAYRQRKNSSSKQLRYPNNSLVWCDSCGKAITIETQLFYANDGSWVCVECRGEN